MPRRTYEQTQKGNPHQLPLKQHVFPARSIARFVDQEGLVRVHSIIAKKDWATVPTDKLFCAMRVWDLRAERGYMKQIEDDFQDLADKVIAGVVTSIDQADKGTVDRFFALWKWRAHFRHADMNEIRFKGISGERLTKDQEEKFEKLGVLYVREGGKAPAHRIHGVQIQFSIDHESSALSKISWGIVRAMDGQFLVPDMPTITHIPLTPTLSLCGGEQDWIVDAYVARSNVVNINWHLVRGCKSYYFAHDLRNCL